MAVGSRGTVFVMCQDVVMAKHLASRPLAEVMRRARARRLGPQGFTARDSESAVIATSDISLRTRMNDSILSIMSLEYPRGTMRSWDFMEPRSVALYCPNSNGELTLNSCSFVSCVPNLNDIRDMMQPTASGRDNQSSPKP